MFHSLSGGSSHQILEPIAYFVAMRVYWYVSVNQPVPKGVDRMLLLAISVFFGFLGSKFLHIAEHLPYLLQKNEFLLWLAGKSVLGGLLGAVLGSELAKRCIGWNQPTGDPWVPALAIGLMIGRVGCQLSGVWDQTYGVPTNLPWAWDYGDGIGRHPTALYEIILVGLALLVARRPTFTRRPGASFALFMLTYCAIRLGLEALKPPFGAMASGTLPTPLFAGFTAIQWAALAGIVWFSLSLRKRLCAPTILESSHG